MTTGSKIQSSLGQAGEVFWCVYVDGQLRGQYMTRVKACMLASTLRREGFMKVKVVRQ